MSISFCVICNKKHKSEFGWKYREWVIESGKIWGWGCVSKNNPYPEFTTKDIKKGREEFASDMVQSHRGGELSREFVELYPDRVKGMIREGSISKRDVEKSKYVWRGDIKYWERNKKIDRDVLLK